MPRSWKPWLTSLLAANMILPLFLLSHVEAWVVFGTALLNGATFVALTAYSGFSRLLGWGHIFWIPLTFFLWSRLDLHPADNFFGIWMRAVIVLNLGSLVLDALNVVRYYQGEHDELVDGL